MEFDYGEIIKQLIEKDKVTGNLEDEKDASDSKHWTALSSYYEAKGKFEAAENGHNVEKCVLSNKKKIRNKIDQEHATLDAKIASLQQFYAQLKANTINQSDKFFDTMEGLYHEFQNLPSEFDNENQHVTIANLKNSINTYELHIIDGANEMEILKSYIENVDIADDLSDVKVVTQIIREESLEKFGNPMKIQHQLSEVRRNNEFLLKKIQDIKVKYGI